MLLRVSVFFLFHVNVVGASHWCLMLVLVFHSCTFWTKPYCCCFVLVLLFYASVVIIFMVKMVLSPPFALVSGSLEFGTQDP